MNYGYVVKKSEDDYLININPKTYKTGYNVVSKSIDPQNKYDIEDVTSYYNSNPDKQISIDQYNNYFYTLNQLQAKQQELDKVNNALFEYMCQDLSNRLNEVQILDSFKDDTMSLLEQKNTLEQEITQLQETIESYIQF